MKILILEDEIPAYEKLLSFVKEALPDCQILGWGRSVIEAEQLFRIEMPDLIFSDIELLDGNSFQVFESLKVDCPIIFCTAFDQYLFQAFQTNGIAYLLKPYTKENFIEALEKYHTLFNRKQTVSIDQNVISELKAIIEGEKKTFKRRFSIRKKGGIKILNVEDIVNFEASGDFCFAYDTNLQKHIISYSLGNIETKLDPNLFFRINRSEIVNIDFIEKIEPNFKNRLSIKIKNRDGLLYTSSNKTPAFRAWLDA